MWHKLVYILVHKADYRGGTTDSDDSENDSIENKIELLMRLLLCSPSLI